MATLRQAIERQREAGAVPPSGAVSLRGLHGNFRPTPPGSTRALMGAMYGRVSERKPWAVILCRFKGSPPELSERERATGTFFREAFTPGSGGFVE